MQYKLYTDLHEFYKDTYEVLMCDETQNMILLGNIITGNEGKDKTDWRDPAKWVMATVSDIRGICLIALMTPPHNITLYSTGNIINQQAIKCLIDGLDEYNIPGVTTEKELANIFAKEYTTQKGLSFKTTMSQRIYELTAVNPDIQQFGVVRLLEEKDMRFFPYWLEAFNAAAVYGNTEMSIPQGANAYHYRLSI